MKSPWPRTGAEVAGIAVYGLLHALAAGALLLVALRLVVPDLLGVGSAAEAWSTVAALGLACLRVPFESGDVSGSFAPLGGLLLTLWGLTSAVRRRSPTWPGPRAAHVAAIALAFSLVCLAAAFAAGSGRTAQPSAPAAAVAGLVWGAASATWGTASHGRGRGAGRRWLAERPRTGPALVVVGVAGALAAGALLVVLVAAAFGVGVSAAFGALLLAVAAAPNALAALVALGLGASVDMVLTGTALDGPSGEAFSLWSWAGRGVAPPHLLALTLVPLVAVVAGGRAAAATAPGDSALRRGLTNGLFLGLAVATTGWLGSFHLSAGVGAGALRLGIPVLEVVALGAVWGIAGAYVGPRLPWPRPQPRGR